MKTLAEVIAEHAYDAYNHWCAPNCAWLPPGEGDEIGHWAAHVAAAYRTARTVTTEADLAALPWYTLIEHRGSPLRKQSKSWYALGSGIRCADTPLPARVLWIPGEEA